MTFSEWLNIILGGIAVIAALGSATAFLLASRGKSIIELQKEELDIQGQKITRLESEAAVCAEAGKAKDAMIARLEQSNTDLKELVNPTPQLQRLTDVVENNSRIVENNSKLIGKLLEGAKK